MENNQKPNNKNIELANDPFFEESDFIARLDAINHCLDEELDLESCMKQLAAIMADSLNANRCSLMLATSSQQTSDLKLKVCAHFGNLPNEAYNELIDLKEGISGQVLISGKPMMINNTRNSNFKHLLRYSSFEQDDGFIVCPLVVSGSVVGVVNISRPKDYRVFSNDDLKTAMTIALMIAQSIQIYQLKNLFRSNFVKLAIAKEAQGKSTQTLNQIVNNNEKAIKVLAKSFYGELNKAGFSRDLIIGSATEIISLVTNAMNENKK